MRPSEPALSVKTASLSAWRFEGQRDALFSGTSLCTHAMWCPRQNSDTATPYKVKGFPREHSTGQLVPLCIAPVVTLFLRSFRDVSPSSPCRHSCSPRLGLPIGDGRRLRVQPKRILVQQPELLCPLLSSPDLLQPPVSHWCAHGATILILHLWQPWEKLPFI